MKHIRFIFVCLLAVIVSSCQQKAPMELTGLRCEMLNNPLGIDCSNPRLSWEIIGLQRDIHQTEYHIIVASSPEKLNNDEGDLWDSGAVSSDLSSQIAYGGKALESRAQCFWKVKVTTNKGESAWSKPARWTMGLLNDSDWQAQWTGLDKSFEYDRPDAPHTRLSARYFRKEFTSESTIKRAVLYISGLGLYKLYINGKEIGEQELSPTPTDYTKSIKYNTFDVTKNIQKKTNTLGIVLGNGRFFTMRPKGVKHFGFPKMIMQLEIEYADGNKQTVISDTTWKVTADGPIRANNEFDGEEYDANKEMPGWNKNGFNADNWLQAEQTDSPGGALKAQINPNIRVMEIIKPIAITEPEPGKYILDMGQNMVGRLKIRTNGKKDDCVTLRFAETLKPDGTLYLDNIREAEVTDKYTLKGVSGESWEPVFTYHGFRYVEITGYPGKLSLNNFEGKVLYDEMETTGTFETSNSVLNQIYKNAYWGIRSNYRGMPTDCPQRDERMGWLGDRATGSLGESFVFNNNNLYAKWLDDIEESQRESGSIPDVAPNYWAIYNDDVTWPAAYLIIANMLYNQYNNIEPIRKHYDSMKKWLLYMKDSYMVDYIMPRDTYGDWCMPPENPGLIHSNDPARKTDGQLLGTSFYYHLCGLMERFAKLLDKQEDAEAYAQLSLKVKEAFNKKFFNEETKQYGNNTVTANLISLCYGMAPLEYETEVFRNITDKTENEFNNHISTGLIGIQWLMRGLSDRGRFDLAFRIATNLDYPSWGYMVESGATTIWELWNGNTAAADMNSGNHVMLLGDLIVWCYEYLAGIQNTSETSTGFKHITMRPYSTEQLNYVKASYHSVHGMIKSAWNIKENLMQWDISVPCNTSATVYIPAPSQDKVTESGKQASSAEGVQFVKTEGEYVVFEVASGNYRFTAETK
ncbi:hypothetical protein EZS27_007415 [termite gut metagenome]|uniref:alpha-L-rhamnosidase n=1 Tax=termite gut metagenome TaxID=433724 RepID=A0A5J4SIA8_9ZZZZ